MIFCDATKTYATVWDVKKNEKYIDLQVSTSEKDPEGKWLNSSWYPRAIGHANNSLKEVKRGDRILITKAKFSNERYENPETHEKKSRFRFLILEASIVGSNQKQEETTAQPTAQPQPITSPESQQEQSYAQPSGDTEEDFPW